jgi:hypothetical protein
MIPAPLHPEGQLRLERSAESESFIDSAPT